MNARYRSHDSFGCILLIPPLHLTFEDNPTISHCYLNSSGGNCGSPGNFVGGGGGDFSIGAVVGIGDMEFDIIGDCDYSGNPFNSVDGS